MLGTTNITSRSSLVVSKFTNEKQHDSWNFCVNLNILLHSEKNMKETIQKYPQIMSI